MDAISVHAEHVPSRRDGRPLLLVAAFILIACSTASDPLRPAPPDTTTGVAPARPPFVAPTRAAAIYNETMDLYDDCASRLVLFEDNTFQLQLACGRRGLLTYGGQYTRMDAAIIFELAGSNASVIRRATAFVAGDTLAVMYNGVMDLEGFANGIYIRERSPDGSRAGAQRATLPACQPSAARDAPSPLIRSEAEVRFASGAGRTSGRV